MTPLQKRLLSSAFFISVSLAAIFWLPRWFFFVVIEGFILCGLNEFFSMVEKKGVVVHRLFGLLCGGLLPFSLYFASESIILVFACLVLFIANFHRRFREQALLGTAATIFGMIYVSWFFSFMDRLHYLENGPTWVFYTILLVKGGDAGAYFVGKSMGRTKLAEHISPNKSVEGAVGGFLVTMALSFISKIYLPEVSFLHLGVLGLMTGVLAQLGDLVESLMKRDVGIKDSGHIPGLGGVLDVLDSLILTAPFVYYYLTWTGLAHG